MSEKSLTKHEEKAACDDWSKIPVHCAECGAQFLRKVRHQKYCDEHRHLAGAVIRPQEALTSNLKRALQKYGRHLDGCRTRDWTTGEKSWDDSTCDCGLHEALSGDSSAPETPRVKIWCVFCGEFGWHSTHCRKAAEDLQTAHSVGSSSVETKAPANVESLDERRKVLRAMDALEAMSEEWAESISLDAIAANLARRPDFNDRCNAIRALIVQAHMEGLYTGRTSHSSVEETKESPLGRAVRIARGDVGPPVEPVRFAEKASARCTCFEDEHGPDCNEDGCCGQCKGAQSES